MDLTIRRRQAKSPRNISRSVHALWFISFSFLLLSILLLQSGEARDRIAALRKPLARALGTANAPITLQSLGLLPATSQENNNSHTFTFEKDAKIEQSYSKRRRLTASRRRLWFSHGAFFNESMALPRLVRFRSSARIPWHNLALTHDYNGNGSPKRVISHYVYLIEALWLDADGNGGASRSPYAHLAVFAMNSNLQRTLLSRDDIRKPVLQNTQNLTHWLALKNPMLLGTPSVLNSEGERVRANHCTIVPETTDYCGSGELPIEKVYIMLCAFNRSQVVDAYDGPQELQRATLSELGAQVAAGIALNESIQGLPLHTPKLRIEFDQVDPPVNIFIDAASQAAGALRRTTRRANTRPLHLIQNSSSTIETALNEMDLIAKFEPSDDEDNQRERYSRMRTILKQMRARRPNADADTYTKLPPRYQLARLSVQLVNIWHFDAHETVFLWELLSLYRLQGVEHVYVGTNLPERSPRLAVLRRLFYGAFGNIVTIFSKELDGYNVNGVEQSQIYASLIVLYHTKLHGDSFLFTADHDEFLLFNPQENNEHAQGGTKTMNTVSSESNTTKPSYNIAHAFVRNFMTRAAAQEAAAAAAAAAQSDHGFDEDFEMRRSARREATLGGADPFGKMCFVQICPIVAMTTPNVSIIDGIFNRFPLQEAPLVTEETPFSHARNVHGDSGRWLAGWDAPFECTTDYGGYYTNTFPKSITIVRNSLRVCIHRSGACTAPAKLGDESSLDVLTRASIARGSSSHAFQAFVQHREEANKYSFKKVIASARGYNNVQLSSDDYYKLLFQNDDASHGHYSIALGRVFAPRLVIVHYRRDYATEPFEENYARTFGWMQAIQRQAKESNSQLAWRREYQTLVKQAKGLPYNYTSPVRRARLKD